MHVGFHCEAVAGYLHFVRLLSFELIFTTYSINIMAWRGERILREVRFIAREISEILERWF